MEQPCASRSHTLDAGARRCGSRFSPTARSGNGGHIRRELTCSLFLLLASFIATPAEGQGALMGRVVNEQAAPIQDARVDLLTTPPRTARTDSSGRFVLAGVTTGSHRLQVRQLGFQPVDVALTMPPGDTVVVVTMRRVVSTLSRVVVRGQWQGIYGTVADSATLKPLANALIRAISVTSNVRTDSLGAFAVDVKQPGNFVLRFELQGYASRVLGVTVARDSAAEVLITLSPSNASDARTQILWREFDSRTRMRGLNSALVPADELAAIGTETASQALLRARSFAIKNLRLHRDICLYVNGEPKPGWTMDAFDVSEILAIEVYGRRGDLTGNLGVRWPKGSPCGPGTGSSPIRLSESDRRLQVQSVVIWLKKQ